MLCRVADSLFWMSRYIERAENTARLVDVKSQLLLELGSYDDAQIERHWHAVLESLDDLGLFLQHHEKTDTQSATEFLTFSRDNPSSVLSCIFAARENARMIRDQISSEMWEIINRLYLFLKQQDAGRVLQAGTSDFFQQIKEMSHLFRGVTDATFPRRVGYEFIKAGCYLERADKTGRILDTQHHLLGPSLITNGSAQDMLQWISILRACTGFEAYHRVYVGNVLPRHVIAFLVLSREFPRSMLFCFNQLQLAVHAISGCLITHYSNEAERACGKLISQVVYSSIDDIVNQGLHPFLAGMQDGINKIAIELSRHYMFFPIVDPTEESEETEEEALPSEPSRAAPQTQTQTQSSGTA